MYGVWTSQEEFDLWHAEVMSKHGIPKKGTSLWTRVVALPDGRFTAPLNGEVFAGAQLTPAEFDEAMLSMTRTRVMEEIDSGTSELLSRGFAFRGQMFSLSPESNILKNGLRHMLPVLDEAMVLPITWNTIDNQSTISLETAEEVDQFWQTAVGTMQARLKEANALKVTIREASREELDFWEDPRF